MRVLHVLPNLDPHAGGPARSVEQLREQLTTQGIAVMAAGRHAANVGDLRLFPAEVRCGPLRLRLPWQLLRPSSCRELARAVVSADLVHLHGLWNATISIAAYYCRRAGVPYVITPHGMLDPFCLGHHGRRKQIYRALIEKATIDGASGFHFLSEEERAQAVLARSLSADRSAVAPNGAPAIPGDVSIEVLRQRFPEAENRRVLLHLGRLDRIKGIDLQLRALARIPADARPLLLLVGPDFGDARRLKQMVRREGLEPWVRFGDAIYGDERFGLLAAADLVLLTSLYDCNPVVVAEALASGAALVATKGIGGIDAAARAGAAVAIDRSESALASIIQDLLRDSARVSLLRQSARTYAAAALKPSELVRPLLRLYGAILHGFSHSGASPALLDLAGV